MDRSFKRVDGNKREKVKKQQQQPRIHLNSRLGKFSFPALAVVVANASYIRESESSILVLLQTHMIKCGKFSIRISWTNCYHYKTLRIYKASDSL